MRITKDNIINEARKRNLKVLKSDLVDKVKNSYGYTPLHELANKGVIEVLNHPSVDQVQNKYGWTPLHWLAWKGVKEILDHLSVDQVKDHYGWTPLYYLAVKDCLTKKDLRKKYPWYKKEIKNIFKAVEEIVNTPDSIRFILED